MTQHQNQQTRKMVPSVLGVLRRPEIAGHCGAGGRQSGAETVAAGAEAAVGARAEAAVAVGAGRRRPSQRGWRRRTEWRLALLPLPRGAAAAAAATTGERAREATFGVRSRELPRWSFFDCAFVDSVKHEVLCFNFCRPADLNGRWMLAARQPVPRQSQGAGSQSVR